MRIYGLTANEAIAIARYIDCDFMVTGEKLTKNGPRTWGRPVPGRGERTPSGRLRKGTEPRYSRYSPERYSYTGDIMWKPRRLHALCFHGLRDFIRQCFEFGATRVESVAGRWDSLAEFNRDLPRLAHDSLNGPGGFDFYTGLGHRTPAPETREDRGPMSARFARQVADDRLKRGKPVIPKAASVPHSLVSDADAIGQSFNDWAGDLGYDTDSRKALETFLACQENGVKLRRILGDLTAFRETLEDY